MTAKNFMVILTIFAGLMLAGCAFHQPDGATDLLSDTGWLLIELGGSPVASSSAMTLNFSDKGKVDGSDGCNQYWSTYTAGNNTINIGEEMAMTERACLEPIMQQAAIFTTALKQAVAYRTENGQLTLLAADGTASAVFLPQNQELHGTSWDVSGYDNGQGTIMRINNSGRKLTASFAADSISGSSGCNSYSADYTYSAVDQTLELGRLLRTMMACTDGNIMQQEGHFITALQTVKSYHIKGNTLTLKAADGSTAVILVRQ
ncbi:MAG: META domain-containing protein [Candidatus Electrothrix communis]|nr:MAG: META domain-containing protein [Candidatus Electrothrix communis]